MLEDKTIDSIHQSLLDNISDDYEKSTGFLTSDLTKSFAIELAKAYDSVGLILDKIDVDNLTGDELAKFVKQRKGTVRKPAGFAKGTLQVIGFGTINQGDLFDTAAGTQFHATETVLIVESGTVNVQAVEAGVSGNVGANSITYIPITIPGILSVTNVSSTSGGYDEESDESLRERYYLELQKPPTSGNVYHYLQWAREVVGVGDARVFPLWNGSNTVKVLIINDSMLPADQALIDEVQDYIDPKGIADIDWGTGQGQAPIGAYCTVVTAAQKDIDVNITATLELGFAIPDVVSDIVQGITDYLKSIAFKQQYVSYAQIGSIVLSVDGVVDWTVLQLNNTTANIAVGIEEVAVLRDVVLNE